MWKANGLPTLEPTATPVACNFNSGQAWPWLALIPSNQQGTPGREKGPFQKHL